MKLCRHQGAALITALFIMAIVVIIATALLARFQIDIERTNLLLTKDKMYLAAQRIPFAAVALLKENITHFPQIFSPKLIDDMVVTGELIDAQSLFNLNNMQDPENKQHFVLLLKAVLPTITDEDLAQLTNAFLYWLSPLPTERLTEEAYFKAGYRVSHLAMSSLSELRLIQGFTPQICQALAPYVIALPKQTPVNINSASIPVLRSLKDGLSIEQAEQIIAARENAQDFKTIANFFNNEHMKDFNIAEKDITVASQYFLVHAQVKKSKQTFDLYCLLERTEKEGISLVKMIWQRFNTL